MDYISAATAAKKFGISKRRVQIYCEQGRIKGVKRISGVWLIPENASKPQDARSAKEKSVSDAELLTLSELAETLSISVATARNWLKLGKLTYSNDNFRFSKEYVAGLEKEIKSGENSALKSRRNKKNVSGNSLYENYIGSEINRELIENIVKTGAVTSEKTLRVVLADIAVKLCLKRTGREIPPQNALEYFKSGKLSLGETDRLINDILGDDNASNICTAPSKDFELEFIDGEDLLGFAYISLRDLGERKSSGAYYTPRKSVEKLIGNLKKSIDLNKKTILDPCCGTGNFLIGLSEAVKNPTLIYGQDIDILSVQIARLNMKLAFRNIDLKTLYSHITRKNTLFDFDENKYDIVLGNPPWGYSFTAEENKSLCKMYGSAQKNGTESYDVFIEKALMMLSENGFLAFVLPEAVMNVAIHEKIRGIIFENCSFSFVLYLGNVFSGVQCPSVILGLLYDKKSRTENCRVELSDRGFTVHCNRKLCASGFMLNISDVEYSCLNCIENLENVVFLKDNADFALGIVTGNNKALLKDVCTDGYEPVLKGSNIYRYQIEKSSCYIKFEPENFQQSAPEVFYRAEEKLFYRFICEAPVFCYDNSKTLSLNSCNILIPRIRGLKIKYIMIVLNSSVAEFFLRKRFNSLKLLRSHLEQLPIPIIPISAQDKLIELSDGISVSGDNASVYNELDEKIMDLYGLDEKKRVTIRRSLQDKKKYLL